MLIDIWLTWGGSSLQVLSGKKTCFGHKGNACVRGGVKCVITSVSTLTSE
jgi:hypothetical protein